MTGRLPTDLKRHVSAKMCCFFSSIFFLHLKCAFANILLISFIFNFALLTNFQLVPYSFRLAYKSVHLLHTDANKQSYSTRNCMIYIAGNDT
jgi:hypothetical protein